jgi:hypothetical protein
VRRSRDYAVRVLRDLARTLVQAPLKKLAPHGVREAALLAAAKLLGVAHRTNASGNNLSQR